MQLPTLSAIDQLACGIYHTLARDSSGKVWAWGYNSGGQVGNGGTSVQKVPVEVLSSAQPDCRQKQQQFCPGIRRFCGPRGYHGSSYQLQFGNTGLTRYLTPTRVGLNDIKQIDYSTVLENDGKVLSWGYNWYGRVGNGSVADGVNPQYVVGPGTNSCRYLGLLRRLSTVE